MILPTEYPCKQDNVARDVTVVHFTGCHVSLDSEALERTQDQLLALADEPCAADLFFDFGNVEYLASTALGTVVSVHRKLLARGRHLTLVNLSPQLKEAFAAARLDEILDLRSAAPGDWPAVRKLPARVSAAVLLEIVDTLEKLAGRTPCRRRHRWIETQ